MMGGFGMTVVWSAPIVIAALLVRGFAGGGSSQLRS
jgi:hypothetical protein